MPRKRVLLLLDFFRQSYAAHRAVLEMHAAERLHVVLLVVGNRAGPPVSAQARQFAVVMANAHISRGATAEVVMLADDDAECAVRQMLSCDAYDLVVAGENLAQCRSCDDPPWVLVDSGGCASLRSHMPPPRAVPALSSPPSPDPAARARARRGRAQAAALVAATGLF